MADTGIGIPRADLERVFAAFYRVKRAVPGEETGPGLGFALARQVVELHGGRIWAESEGEGRGRRFFFALPLATREAVEATAFRT